jgi:hypothetical protein
MCDQRAGALVQAPSRPLVMVSSALPLPNLFFQPRPCSSSGAPSGSGPTLPQDRGTVGFAEGVTTGDERDGFLVVHGHAGEGLADVLGGGERIGLPLGPSGFT